MKTYIDRLRGVTYSLHHSPSCAKPFEVRLIGEFEGRLDNNPDYTKTKDILGHGQTFEEAAQEVWKKKFGNS